MNSLDLKPILIPQTLAKKNTDLTIPSRFRQHAPQISTIKNECSFNFQEHLHHMLYLNHINK
jgi:hypothetical protein